MSKYPESDKIDSNSNGILQEFVSFLKSNNYLLRKGTTCYENHISFQSIIYEYFEVDSVKLEKERRLMLEDLNE